MFIPLPLSRIHFESLFGVSGKQTSTEFLKGHGNQKNMRYGKAKLYVNAFEFSHKCFAFPLKTLRSLAKVLRQFARKEHKSLQAKVKLLWGMQNFCERMQLIFPHNLACLLCGSVDHSFKLLKRHYALVFESLVSLFMQRIWGNEIKEAAAAKNERIPHSIHVKKSEFPTSYQRRTPCRGIFPTWRFGWKAGTPVSLRFVLHSNPVIHASVSKLTTTF